MYIHFGRFCESSSGRPERAVHLTFVKIESYRKWRNNDCFHNKKIFHATIFDIVHIMNLQKYIHTMSDNMVNNDLPINSYDIVRKK
jgi:hypothetical protein